MPQLKAGYYLGEFVRGVCGQTPNTGTPYLDLVWDVTQYADGGAWETMDRREPRHTRYFLSEKAWQYTEEKLAKLGFNGSFENPDIDPKYHHNVTLSCTVQVNNTDGKEYEEWEPVDAMGGGKEIERKPLSQDKMRLLSERWRRNQTQNQQKPATPPPEPPSPAPAPPVDDGTADDDIPF